MTSEIVKILEITSGIIDPTKRIFQVDPNGRINGLKVNRNETEYDLYIYMQNRFFKDSFSYETHVYHYYKSDAFPYPIFIKMDILIANDTYYVNQYGQLVAKEEAIDEHGNVKPGYMTEAQFFELYMGPSISQFETAAVIRKYGLPIPS